MSDIEYLQSANIIKLMQAARLAGLRWKNGEPGYDKAGIIQKLQYSPSIMRATTAALRNMEKGTYTPQPAPSVSDWRDDIDDEKGRTPAPSGPPVVSTLDPDTLADLRRRLGIIEGDYVTRGGMVRIMESGMLPLAKGIEALKAEVIELKARKPVQFVIDKQEFPPITGQHERFPDLIAYLKANKRVMLIGPAGTGKSTAARNAAKYLGVDFYLQNPVSMPHELIGHRDGAGVFHTTPLFEAFTKGGLCLCDEFDSSDANALLVGNAIFDGNGYATFGDGKVHRMSENFYLIANANTDGTGANMEYPGRVRLDGATLNRFAVHIRWNIAKDIEAGMARGCDSWHKAIIAIRDMMASRGIQDVNATPRTVAAGANLLSIGIPRAQVLSDCLKTGALAECWPALEALPAVRAFLQGA